LSVQTNDADIEVCRLPTHAQQQSNFNRSNGTMEQATAPSRRQCGAMSVHYRLLEMEPSFRQRQIDIEHMTARRVVPGATVSPGKHPIPVVVHVIKKARAEKIPTAKKKRQIPGIKKDFRATNSDKRKVPNIWKGLVADARVQFALATTDPTGKSTSGITRTKTTRTSFGTGDTVKSSASGGADPWSSDRYLNLWVCTLGGGLLGYAQFPGGPPATDGVVILNTAFGTR